MKINEVPNLTSKQRDILSKIKKFPYNIMYDALDQSVNTNIDLQIAFQVGWLVYDSFSIDSVNKIINTMSEEKRIFIKKFYQSKSEENDDLIRKLPTEPYDIKLWKNIQNQLQQPEYIEYIKNGAKHENIKFVSVPSASTEIQTTPYEQLFYIVLKNERLLNLTKSSDKTDDSDIIIANDTNFTPSIKRSISINCKKEAKCLLSNINYVKGLEYVLSNIPNELYPAIVALEYNVPDNDMARMLNVSSKTIKNIKIKALYYLFSSPQKEFILNGYDSSMQYMKKININYKQKESQCYNNIADVPVTLLYEICSLPTVLRLKPYIEKNNITNIAQIDSLTDDELKQALDMKSGSAIVNNIKAAIDWIKTYVKTI